MRTAQWIKKLGGHAGELFVCAELSKRGVLSALLPENFSDDDILISNKDGTETGFVQVKACHPDRADSFFLTEKDEKWQGAAAGHFCVLVWLGGTRTNEPPNYWIAEKREVGELCIARAEHGTSNFERRFVREDLPPHWENRWSLFDRFRPLPPA